MNWKKIGICHIASMNSEWACSHAQLPTALTLDDSTVRVFFATRSVKQESSISYVDLKFSNADSFEVSESAKKPVLSPGPLGNFDEHGVFPSSIVKHDSKYYMYYIGWNRGCEAPLFYASIGLATSLDGINFQKESPAPLLSRSAVDPCLITSPCVIKTTSDRWLMSYTSGIRWTRNDENKLQSHYHIKLAESIDLYNWDRKGSIAVDFQEGETNIARPSMVKLNNGSYGMWFCYVNSNIGKYRIGFSISDDSKNWTRRDDLAPLEVGCDLTKDMICYPNVFELNDEKYMLYNGDQFGLNGFGVALLTNSQ